MLMNIKIEQLKKYYGSFCAVNNVSFSFSSGHLMALVGRNGSGKTTTIRTMLGLMKKDGGRILINGKEGPVDQKRVGYLAEERGMFLKENVVNQLRFFARLKGLSKKDAEIAIDYWLERLEMKQHKEAVLESLSKGNQQKIQMIACLLHDPDIIIFDEPFSGLDPVNMQTVINLLNGFKNEGKCVLVSSHQLALIEGICDNITIINESNVLYTGTINNLMSEHTKEYVTVSLKEAADIPRSLKAEKKDELNYNIDLNRAEEKDFNLFLKRLVEYDLPICSIERGHNSLQDIFLDIIGMDSTGNRKEN